ncbi:hypothetical protein D3C73_1474850 [compost metagenome]
MGYEYMTVGMPAAELSDLSPQIFTGVFKGSYGAQLVQRPQQRPAGISRLFYPVDGKGVTGFRKPCPFALTKLQEVDIEFLQKDFQKTFCSMFLFLTAFFPD